jgi:hypothetical protein
MHALKIMRSTTLRIYIVRSLGLAPCARRLIRAVEDNPDVHRAVRTRAGAPILENQFRFSTVRNCQEPSHRFWALELDIKNR